MQFLRRNPRGFESAERTYIEKIDFRLSNCQRRKRVGFDRLLRAYALAYCWLGTPKRYAFRYRPRRFRLKICHRHISFTPKPSRVRIRRTDIYRKDRFSSIKLSKAQESGIRPSASGIRPRILLARDTQTLRISVPPSPLSAKNMPPAYFLYAETLAGSNRYTKRNYIIKIESLSNCHMAERVGFEPTVRCRTTVFKTVPL